MLTGGSSNQTLKYHTRGGATTPSPSKRKFFFGIPCYDGRTFVPCTQTLMNLVIGLTQGRIGSEVSFVAGLPYVDMARNNIVAQFMKSDCTDLVMIDADVGVSREDMFALMDSDEDVVCGVYRKKCEEEIYAVMLMTDEDKHPINRNGCLLAEGGPTGFMKIRRHVLDRMIAAHPELEYVDYLTNEPRWHLFGAFVKDRRFYGDDYAFCYRWREMGGEVAVLPNITFIHTGSKHYIGNLWEHMVKVSKATEEVGQGTYTDVFQPAAVVTGGHEDSSPNNDKEVADVG